MKSQWLLTLLAGSAATAFQPARPGAEQLIHALHGPKALKTHQQQQRALFEKRAPVITESPPSGHRFLTDKTSPFAVNGTGLPDIKFDVGESYSGDLPVSNKTDEANKLFFWYFPTANEEFKDKKEIVIWLNGGPGCSSLLGFFQENGPLVWQPGTKEPVQNPWSWHLLSNVVWVEQPVGVGYTEGKPTIHNEDELAEQFKGFWKNFVDTFDLHDYKVYVTGESYGGMYCPYIASHFVDAKDTKYFDVAGMLVYDGIFYGDMIQSNVIAWDYMVRHPDQFAFDDNSKKHFKETSDKCGFGAYNKKYLKFPPPGPQPHYPPGVKVYPNGSAIAIPECGSYWNDIYEAAIYFNPCFNIYNILDHCPLPYDPLGDGYAYFDRADVKKALHAPLANNWTECSGPVYDNPDGDDPSRPSGDYEVGHVIDATKNVILAQGEMDFILMTNGLLLGIQNTTFGGKLGFQSVPSDPFYVPRYGLKPGLEDDKFYGASLPAGSGVMGTTHSERGLTFVVTQLAGHEGPQYAPASSLRHLEKLLGRVDSLSSTKPFTLPQLKNITQDKPPLGKGIVKIP
ncbi:putative serine carboxypeptidase [Cladobotryum mycophilum]|uniref:Carboxypeptidase n=1 Tax=Cladobotryum mycophilum TaxID=491253 RepID=A0ABR0SVA7_9HYPO